MLELVQGKLNNHQQNQNDAVDVDNDSNCLRVIENFIFHSASVKGHKHGHQLQQSLVGIRDGKPHNSSTVQTHVYIVVVYNTIILNVRTVYELLKSQTDVCLRQQRQAELDLVLDQH